MTAVQLLSQTSELDAPESATHAGDILLLPVALAAFWTVAYQLVLIARWPARSIIWLFFVITVLGLLFAARSWKRTHVVPGYGYHFHLAHVFLLLLAMGCATVPLFILRPNQDDVVYFHRALAQLSVLSRPIFTRQTSVDADASAFSPVHLATSHEFLMALFGHYFRIDPLYCYQVLGHVFAAFFIPFICYWCVRIFGLGRWLAVLGAMLAVTFLLIDSTGLAAFGQTAFTRMWQGKCIVWILFLPVALSLTYRFLREGNNSDLLWLALLTIAGVGLSSSALYLVPATIGCSCIAICATQLFDREGRATFWQQLRRCCLLAVPCAYPIAILVLLKLNVILRPTDVQGFGPAYIPWQQGLKYVVGGTEQHLRNIIILVAVPLIIVRGKSGLFLFFYICAVWLLCLNPSLANLWMENIFAACYFRLVYLLPLPLLCAMLAMSIYRWSEMPRGWFKDWLLTSLAVFALLLVCVHSFRRLSIMPITKARGWKSPSEYQLLPANIDFARAARGYIARSKLLAPAWTASCELPLLFPRMKIVAPRLVTHYFANAGHPEEGLLRRRAQAFIEGEKTDNAERAAKLAESFQTVIASGRANALAVPQRESARVLLALQAIDPRWHRVLNAGGLVLMLPDVGEPYRQNKEVPHT
jgi:hypothetical protein